MPELPSTFARDAAGRTTVRVVRLTAPLRVDGNLDEEFYRSVTPISDMIQVEPQAGAEATEKTEVWLSFDADNIYVSVRASETHPERMIANEMRRDSSNVYQNENIMFSFDSFYDHRNSVNFQFNPIGGRGDAQVTNETQYNPDWNPIWRLQVRRVEGGWTAESAIPFKSLRYRPGPSQVWGFQVRRINRWKNEVSYFTKLPANSRNNGFMRVSLYAAMVGLEVPGGGTRALDLKPYVTSNVKSERLSSSSLKNTAGRDFGFDAKYAVTQILTTDFTYNTDFAQVEADEQQVNLTRFSLFFPEKRDFFLENRGLFQFAAENTLSANSDDVPVVFYSRRIGLESGVSVPIAAGGRVSGRVGRYSVGVLNIQADKEDRLQLPSTNFTVARLKRDIFGRSAIGGIYTRRAATNGVAVASKSVGVDTGLAFFGELYINAYWAKALRRGVSDDNDSHRAQLFYNTDRWGLLAERLRVGSNFDPQVGFVRRSDFTKHRALVRFDPRPRRHFKAVRKFGYQASVNYYTDGSDRLETREQNVAFSAEFQISEKLTIQYERNYERIDVPFLISPGVRVPGGAYDNATFTTEFQVGTQRRMSGTWWLETGPFYRGDRTAVGYRAARVNVTPQLAVEPSLSINRATLPYGDFTAKLVSARTTYTVTPLMFISGLVQYNSSGNSLSSNVRLRWEYQPGSELFVVYNDGRDTSGDRFATLQNRSFIIKFNRLFRF